MMMMRMTLIMDTMIKSLHNQCILLHRDDIMIRDEYADDFDDMVFMMFILCTSAQSSLCLLSLQCDQVTFNCGILVAAAGGGVETKGGNGRAKEGEKLCFCFQNDLKEP